MQAIKEIFNFKEVKLDTNFNDIIEETFNSEIKKIKKIQKHEIGFHDLSNIKDTITQILNKEKNDSIEKIEKEMIDKLDKAEEKGKEDRDKLLISLMNQAGKRSEDLAAKYEAEYIKNSIKTVMLDKKRISEVPNPKISVSKKIKNIFSKEKNKPNYNNKTEDKEYEQIASILTAKIFERKELKTSSTVTTGERFRFDDNILKNLSELIVESPDMTKEIAHIESIVKNITIKDLNEIEEAAKIESMQKAKVLFERKKDNILNTKELNPDFLDLDKIHKTMVSNIESEFSSKLNKILYEYKEKEDTTSRIYYKKLTEYKIQYNPELSDVFFKLPDIFISKVDLTSLNNEEHIRSSQRLSQDSGFNSQASRLHSTSSKGSVDSNSFVLR